jgi:hypothetical protein
MLLIGAEITVDYTYNYEEEEWIEMELEETTNYRFL